MLEDLVADRKKKLAKLTEAGVDPYPIKTKRTHIVSAVLKDFSKLEKSRKKVFIAGRVMGLRDMGNVMFLDVADESGKLQVILKKDNLKNFKLLKDALDRGDFVSAGGTLFKTKTKQQSIEAKELTLLSKSLRPLPDKWAGLEDVETRLRKRYLDLLAHPELRELFVTKAKFWSETRAYLLATSFLEVETPVLEIIPGGAEAEPFITHYNALDEDVYLRISPELRLKRLMVGGFERVFEIGRIFRNEGIDKEHLQDFTTMEMYWAYQDYDGLMKFLEGMVKHVIKETFGSLTTTYGGKKIDWGAQWKRYDYYELLKKYAGVDLRSATREELLERARVLNIDSAELSLGRGRLIDLIYKKTVRPKLIEPGFLIDPPVDIEPLAKRMVKDRNRVERFQIVAVGTELGKGFTELNDPLDQRERFEAQMKLREAGDKEAQMLDDDYLEAMEYGMPPTAGFAYGERLFAILVDKPMREAVLFPLTRKK